MNLFSQRKSFTALAIKFALPAAIFLLVGAAAFAQSGNSVKKPEKCWEYPVGENSATAVFSDNGMVYVVSEPARLVAVNTENGNEEWSSELGGEVVSNIVAAGESVFIATSSIEMNGVSGKHATLRSLSRQTGLPGTSMSLPGSKVFHLHVDDGTIVAIGSEGSVTAFTTDGTPVWNFAVGGTLSAGPVGFRSGFTFASDDRTVRHISVRTGETLSRLPGGSLPTAIARDTNGTIFLGDNRGRLFRLNADSGKVEWSFKSGGRFENLEIADSHLIAASVDNFLYYISTGRGSVVWKRRLPGRMLGRPMLAEDTITVAVYGESDAFIMERNSGRIVGRIHFGEGVLPTAEPVISSDGTLIFNLQNRIAAYRLDACKK